MLLQKLKKDPSTDDEMCETGKLCLDDSEVAVDAAQELLPINEADAACETCKQASCNALGQPEDLLICKDCNLKCMSESVQIYFNRCIKFIPSRISLTCSMHNLV